MTAGQVAHTVCEDGADVAAIAVSLGLPVGDPRVLQVFQGICGVLSERAPQHAAVNVRADAIRATREALSGG